MSFSEKQLLDLAALERRLAEEIKAANPHNFMQDDPAAFAACLGAIMRAEALEKMAEEARENAI